MGFADEVPKVVAALAAKSGRYDERTPKMTATQMCAVLGLFSQPLPAAIRRVCDAGVQRADWVASDGAWQAPASVQAFAWQDTISAEVYLFQSVAPSYYAPWQRTPSKLTDEQIFKAKAAGVVALYEPARMPSAVRNDQTELVSFVRQTVADYERALGNIGSAIRLYPGTVAGMEICQSFMSAIRSFASDLDVLHENPPTTWGQDVKGALGAALTASEDAAVDIAKAGGNALAWAGNVAGKVAGAAASGFFSTANLTTLAVAGVVGYIALRRYV